ncbi:MAG: response regulator [Paracoccaceae bacterium]
MPDFPDNFPLGQSPTADRPLLGLTVLMVEDSRYASEAMRLLCLRSGARIRRADNLASAHRHLAVYRPSVVIVDLGLPDGSGEDLIAELARATPRVGVILGTSGNDDGAERAVAAGADGFIAKPIENLAVFQGKILDHLPVGAHPKGLRRVSNETILPDLLALHDDLAHIAEVLSRASGDQASIDYAAQFLSGVARIAHDNKMEDAAADLARHCARGQPYKQDIDRITGLVQNRLQQRKVV